MADTKQQRTAKALKAWRQVGLVEENPQRRQAIDNLSHVGGNVLGGVGTAAQKMSKSPVVRTIGAVGKFMASKPFGVASALLTDEGLGDKFETVRLDKQNWDEWKKKNYKRFEDQAVEQVAGRNIPEVQYLGSMPFESVRRKQILHSLKGGGSVNELMLPTSNGWYEGGNNPVDYTDKVGRPFITGWAGHPHQYDWENHYGDLDLGYGRLARNRAAMIRQILADYGIE